eukprot:scaffold1954_cov268-Pinguiococcus_pyrenoidosus.AAC.22
MAYASRFDLAAISLRRFFCSGYDDYTNCVWDASLSSFSPAFGSLQGHENRVSCLGVRASMLPNLNSCSRRANLYLDRQSQLAKELSVCVPEVSATAVKTWRTKTLDLRSPRLQTLAETPPPERITSTVDVKKTPD